MIRALKSTQVDKIVIVCALLSLLRIWVSWLLGNVVPQGDDYDSILMVEYANVFDHFWTASERSLMKTMSYPLFLTLPSFLGISYNIVLSLFWIISGILCAVALSKVLPDRRFVAASYLFVIWAPIAFEVWGGVRIYRNSIITPSLFSLFALLFLFTSRCLTDQKARFSVVSLGALTGAVFFFSFYIKEDGFWMLPLLYFVMIVCIVGIAIRAKRKRITSKTALSLVVAVLLPLIVFQIGTGVYKSINYHYFGVAEVNTRTEGELGEFVKKIYKIDSEDRTSFIWAPYDAIEEAFDASPTLSSYPELEESILNTVWFREGDHQAPINGDFLGWVMRTSLVDTGLWESEAQIQTLFAQVNEELDAAFDEGALVKEDRIFLTGSAGPRTLNEIVGLGGDTLMVLTSPLTFYGYRMDANAYRNSGITEMSEADEYLFNQYVGKLDDPGLSRIEEMKTNIGEAFSGLDLALYRVFVPLMFLASVVGFIWTLVNLVRKRQAYSTEQKLAFFSIPLLGLMALVYSFGICWFSEFIYEGNLDSELAVAVLNLYGIGVIPMLYLCTLLGDALLLVCLKRIVVSRREKANRRRARPAGPSPTSASRA